MNRIKTSWKFQKIMKIQKIKTAVKNISMILNKEWKWLNKYYVVFKLIKNPIN